MFLSSLESEGGLLGNQRMEQVEGGSQKEPVGHCCQGGHRLCTAFILVLLFGCLGGWSAGLSVTLVILVKVLFIMQFNFHY